MIEVQVFDGILRCLFTDMVMLDWSDIAELSTAKLATYTVLGVLRFDFWKISAIGNCTNSPKSKVTASGIVQMVVFDIIKKLKLNFSSICLG